MSFTYQWQWQQVGWAGVWTNVIEGVNADSLVGGGGIPRFTAAGAATSSIAVGRSNTPQGSLGVIAALCCVVTNTCGSVTSNAAMLTVCAADFNCSGAISVQDVFDFLAAYFAADPRADFNASSTISVQDIFDFLAAYFAGC